MKYFFDLLLIIIKTSTVALQRELPYQKLKSFYTGRRNIFYWYIKKFY